MRATRISASSFISCSRIDRTSEIEKELQRQHNIGGFNRYLAYTDEAPTTVSFSKLIENGEVSVEKASQRIVRRSISFWVR